MLQHPVDYIARELRDIYTQSEVKILSRLVLREVAGWTSAEVATRKDTELSATERLKLKEIVSRLKKNEPYQYIFGHAEFYGLSFYVNRFTLIPRPETEELVEWMLYELNAQTAYKILDVGTGSGCIAIALAKKLPNAQIYACDISREALAVANKNAEKHGVKVQFFPMDILNPEPLVHQWDVIVSNPPYITESEKKSMERVVLDFEPHQALFVPDDDAMLFYRHITMFAKDYLKKNGRIFFELNREKASTARALLENNGFSPVMVKKDISGNDRMLCAQKCK